MGTSSANSQTEDKSPRLWIERLCLFRNIKPVDIIRDIPLRRGINIVWAHEPHPTDKISGLLATGQAPFQYILTTTSSPPKRLQKKPFLRLTLSPQSDNTMLFKKRFGIEQNNIVGLGDN